jgi:Ala-tRNA(Pro) deacylase
MTVTSAELTRTLRAARIPFELLPHARTERATDEAAALHVAPEEVAKTVVLVTPRERVRMVIPASERLDLDLAREAIGDGPKVELASERRLARDFPMFELGAVPPVGGPSGDRVIVDRRLARCASVVFEAGSHDTSLRVMTSDLVRLTDATLADLCTGGGDPA